jgi:hypothetical protein
MKKLITSVFVTLVTLGSIQSYAQTLTRADYKQQNQKREEHKSLRKLASTQASTLAMDNFYADFGKVEDARWARNATLDEVTFTKGQYRVAFYGNDNKLVSTTYGRKVSELPTIIQKEITKQYKAKGYQVGAVIEYVDNQVNK